MAVSCSEVPPERRGVNAHPQRHLDWDGCFNVRDLGGLRTTDGRETRWGGSFERTRSTA